MDSITLQKRNVKRKIQRTIRRLQGRMDTYKASIYYCTLPDASGYWKAMDELRASLARQRSALRRIERL